MNRTIHNPIVNDTVTFLQTSAESGGTCTELELKVLPGGGNAPPFHQTYTETFTVLRGVLTLELDRGLRKTLSAGESYVIEAGQTHSYHNETNEPLWCRNRLTPGSEGFESTLRILYGLAADGLTRRTGIPTRLQDLAVCAVISDTSAPGILAFANPILRLVACFARWRGVEADLRRRYV